jgi:hypothetical protein
MDLPRFDEDGFSLGTTATKLHLTEVSVAAVLGAGLLFLWLERSGRASWAKARVRALAPGVGPYRTTELHVPRGERAPRLVLLASLAALVFGNWFVPVILLALSTFPFDGVGIPLIPGVALALANWICGWLLLRRSPYAAAAARSSAICSLVANVGLLAMSAAHLVLVEYQRMEGIAHACSKSITLLGFVFAVASVGQALLLLAVLRSHAAVLDETSPVHRPVG